MARSKENRSVPWNVFLVPLLIILGGSCAILNSLDDDPNQATATPPDSRGYTDDQTSPTTSPGGTDQTYASESSVPNEALTQFTYQNIAYLCMQINTARHGYSQHVDDDLPIADTASHIIRLIGSRGIPTPNYLYKLGKQVIPIDSLDSADNTIITNTANGWEFCIKDNPAELP